MPSEAHESGPARRPIGATVISIIVALEALALLAGAVWFGVELIVDRPQSYSVAVVTLVILLILGAWQGTVGHFLFRGYRWTRSAALVWQLFMLVLGIPALTNGQVLVGLLLTVPPVIAAVLLFTGPVVAFTQRRVDSPAL